MKIAFRELAVYCSPRDQLMIPQKTIPHISFVNAYDAVQINDE